jgi:PAS domain S-box-containing protein
MHLPYAYTPQIWPSIFTALVLIVLSLFAWRRRSVPGAAPFTIALLFAAVWSAGSVMELSALDLAGKIFWVKFQAAWQLPTVSAITCFILEYTWPGRWLTKRALALLSISVLLGMALIFTDSLHHWIWRGFSFDGTINPQINTGGWLLTAYGYGFTIVNLIALTWLALHSPQHRWPAALIVISQLAIRALYLLEKTLVIQSVLPLDILGIGFGCLIYALALFSFRLFDPVAMARQTLMEQLSDGMLVVDRQGRVASLNPAAERVFALPARQAPGRPVKELLPAYPEGLQPVPGGSEIEFSLETGGEMGYYRLVISRLNDWRGQEAGRLLLLHDVSDQKRAQAQLLEQQRALAMLHEREQLARELHDNLSQTLGFTGIQLEAAYKTILDGQVSTGLAQLNRLVSIVREAYTDLRENILNLHTAPVSQQPFFSALRRYLEGFTDNYAIQTRLDVDERLGEQPFPQDVRMQVFRILQEALSNARKHARARCVQVSFTQEDRSVCMTIQDDGAGFDPTLAAAEGHFGLKFMRERAAELGGRLEVESAVGEGTRVMVVVPIISRKDAKDAKKPF